MFPKKKFQKFHTQGLQNIYTYQYNMVNFLECSDNVARRPVAVDNFLAPVDQCDYNFLHFRNLSNSKVEAFEYCKTILNTSWKNKSTSVRTGDRDSVLRTIRVALIALSRSCEWLECRNLNVRAAATFSACSCSAKEVAITMPREVTADNWKGQYF